ncbi:TetR/AcrR family transcriptional regulator [Streptomyces albofaciens JCM 4342]|uniref:TetR/AcrR family transcriptional regulator n=1 Tax=Streptomyces albofaciens TaxID=66866 RepID=UPI00123C72D4|nr:TetR/AcrR family transcriptional regulator [Streptomyces albofaciens]KAA6214263.1 TetR/AcrR family transcriptional regulator [Streptomyces albofaciens JCM 4342]
MARPRKFDEERAVDAAMNVFRAAGYEATSTQDLCEATGLGRSSIYNTFKSKHDLFERALDRYMGERNGELFALMESDLPVREKIRTHLERVVEEECGDQDDRRGCLVVNTAVEVAARDQQVAGELARDYRLRLEVIRAALASGQRVGDIDADKDVGALAHLVIAAVGGLRVSARCGAGRAALSGVVEGVMAAL